MWVNLISPLLFCLASAQDPSNSWLSYAAATEGASAKVTALNCSWKVPADPLQKQGSNAPGWWFGIQTANGKGALIQPILAWADGTPQWTIFNGVFDWNDRSWHQSKQITVQPGDQIDSAVVYDAAKKEFVMYIVKRGGTPIITPYKEYSGQIESVAYFVLEHQPRSCKSYPPDGKMSFTNIVMQVDGKTVTSPKWHAEQQKPACDSKAVIVSPTQIDFTWSASSTNMTNLDESYVSDEDLPAFARFGRRWSTDN